MGGMGLIMVVLMELVEKEGEIENDGKGVNERKGEEL